MKPDNGIIYERFVPKSLPILKNIDGKEQGFGACFNCGDRWNWKTPHYIFPPAWLRQRGFISGGIFPYCDECNSQIGKTAKVRATLRLGRIWLAVDPRGLRGKLLCIREIIEAVIYILLGG